MSKLIRSCILSAAYGYVVQFYFKISYEDVFWHMTWAIMLCIVIHNYMHYQHTRNTFPGHDMIPIPTSNTDSIGKAVLVRDVLEVKDASQKYAEKIICIHEAGHAVIAVLKNIPFSKVKYSFYSESMVELNENPKVYQNENDFLMRALMTYGGMAAEEVFFGEFHAGCLGNANADIESAEQYIRYGILLSKDCKYKVLHHPEVDKLVVSYSAQLYEEAIRIINEHKEAVKRVAKDLLYAGSLTEMQVRGIMYDYNEPFGALKSKYRIQAEQIMSNIQKEIPLQEIGQCEMRHNLFMHDLYEWARECDYRNMKIIGINNEIENYKNSDGTEFDIALCIEDNQENRFWYYYRKEYIESWKI